MSCSYYFEKWKKTLIELDELIKLDNEYQETKAHDNKWCDAVQRLTGILGKYMLIYNDTADCCRHNLQVQKTGHMTEIVKAVVTRILEIKDQLRKLTGTEYQFMGNGLTDHKLTTYEIELSDVLPKQKRDEKIKTLVSEAIQKAEDRKRESIRYTEITESEEKVSRKVNWWDNDNSSEGSKGTYQKGINVTAVYELQKKEEVTFEMLEKRKMATLIQAHERSRNLTLVLIQHKQKRDRWEKELNGTLRPPAKYEIREKSARKIQKICRAYFEIKRNRIKECKRDEILAMRLCERMYQRDTENEEAMYNITMEKYKEYERQWNVNYNKLKQKYIKTKHDIIEDDIRDEIMYWFRKWFNEALVFHDIPKEGSGGSILIVKEETPTPEEWLEKYEANLKKKRASKNKSAYELKYEKLEARKEKLMQKRAEYSQKKMEEKILKKMMKNPKFHPGYHYPKSKKINHLIQAVEDYKTSWSSLDIWEEPGVKEKYVIDIDINNAYMDAKIEIRKSVDVAMREAFDVLNTALIEDYKRKGEQMPEQIKEKIKRRKKQRKHKMEAREHVPDKLESLAYRGFLKEYPHVKIEDFIGDPNFAGDGLRCNLQAAQAFSAETRALWWERCRELSHGAHRILLVGAKGSGKTTLVHALASINDAVLYEIDPAWFPEELLSAVYLQELAGSIAACARATQPSVIFIRHLHRLHYTKAPPGEDVENLNLIKRYLLRKLLRKVHKDDNITIAEVSVRESDSHLVELIHFTASCIDPWLAKSTKMLKQFPSVMLLPNTNYSTVQILLNKWILDNHAVPRDLDIQSLAHALQGYSFGYIKDTLTKFLTADRIIRMAAYGLPLQDIHECFLESGEVQVEYNKYLKWYTDKSHWGKKGKKILEDQKEFQLLLEKWEQKKKKKKNLNSTISDVSTNIDSKL